MCRPPTLPLFQEGKTRIDDAQQSRTLHAVDAARLSVIDVCQWSLLDEWCFDADVHIHLQGTEIYAHDLGSVKAARDSGVGDSFLRNMAESPSL